MNIVRGTRQAGREDDDEHDGAEDSEDGGGGGDGDQPNMFTLERERERSTDLVGREGRPTGRRRHR